MNIFFFFKLKKSMNENIYLTRLIYYDDTANSGWSWADFL